MFRNIYDLKTNDFYKELVEIKNMNLKIKDLINNQINFKDYIICGFTENNLIEFNFTKYNNKN